MKRTVICFAAFLVCGLFIAGFAATHVQYQQYGNWDTLGTGSMNLSAFVYRDVNRNGKYDLPDAPMSGVVVGITNAQEITYYAFSNENGFANFESTRKSEENAPLKEPGRYQFTVHPPPGWRISSGNRQQQAELIRVSGSPSGLGLNKMMKPVGLIQPLYIAGSLPCCAPYSLFIRPEGQAERPVEVSADGLFRLSVKAGTYHLRNGDSSRTVTVKEYPLHIGTFDSATAPLPSQDQPLVVRFDDVTAEGLRKIPNGYAGLDWFNLNAMNRYFGGNTVGYVNSALSGNTIAYTSSGHPAEISASQPFAVHEMYLAVAWPEAEGEIATVTFYRDEQKIREDKLQLTSFGPLRYRPMIANVTRMRLSTQHYWQIVLDDITVAPVPTLSKTEPLETH